MQVVQLPESIWHWNVEPDSEEVNANDALLVVIVPDGPEPIVVSGAVVSAGGVVVPPPMELLPDGSMPMLEPSSALPAPGELLVRPQPPNVLGAPPPEKAGVPTTALVPDEDPELLYRLLVLVQLTQPLIWNAALIITLSLATKPLFGSLSPEPTNENTSVPLTTLWMNVVPLWWPSWIAEPPLDGLMKTLLLMISWSPPSGAMIAVVKLCR